LSLAWRAGARLYRAQRRIDAARGVGSWEGALDWLASFDEPIAEIQYWGHGRWGRALIDRDDVLDAAALSAGHRLRAPLEAVRERLAPNAPEAAKGSLPWRTNTITCLHDRVPDAWFD
jgi:hypothetical protein